MSAIPESGTARLLFFMEQRLAQLRWSRENLAAEGGPSPSTVYKSLLGGRQPTERTLARLELALGWQAGSSHRILSGGAPALSVAHELIGLSGRIDAELQQGEDIGVRHTAAELREFLLEVAARLRQFYGGSDDAVGKALDVRTG
ncbi:helix-turn-helix domain-containing protein [Mycolicibacterium septicum]|uniref:helix-turn-helix domain-containing protein n=1 Tax=Mycolicibacterium septicum TaxID=98668 RepID=UPI00235F7DA7|nr:helix-turn-helix transcriptional regulator [Mycolicibacterium septicum]